MKIVPIDMRGYAVRNFSETSKRPQLRSYGKFVADLHLGEEKIAIVEKAKVDAEEYTFLFTNKGASQAFTHFAAELNITTPLTPKYRDGLFNLLLMGYSLREMMARLSWMPRRAGEDLAQAFIYRKNGGREGYTANRREYAPETLPVDGFLVVIESQRLIWADEVTYFSIV